MTLHIAECDISKATIIFNRHPTTPPARVFSGVIAWPSLRGLPGTSPAPWGGINGRLVFPFQQPWVYSGTTDMMLDYDFDGGLLANNGFWPTHYRREYVLDGFGIVSNTSHGSETRFGKILYVGGCVDQGAIYGWGGHAQLGTTTVGPKTTNNPNT